jgi:hypothetical protein
VWFSLGDCHRQQRLEGLLVNRRQPHIGRHEAQCALNPRPRPAVQPGGRRGILSARVLLNDPLTICPATSALTIADNYADAQFASHPDETASGTAALPAALVAELSFAPTAAAVADAEQAAGVRPRIAARATSQRARPRVLLPADYRAAAHGVGAVLVGGRTRPHRRPAAGRNGRSPASWAAIRPRSAEILRRNADPATGAYRPFTAHRRALGRRPRPRPAKLVGDVELRTMVQQLLDRRWSPE